MDDFFKWMSQHINGWVYVEIQKKKYLNDLFNALYTWLNAKTSNFMPEMTESPCQKWLSPCTKDHVSLPWMIGYHTRKKTIYVTNMVKAKIILPKKMHTLW